MCSTSEADQAAHSTRCLDIMLSTARVFAFVALAMPLLSWRSKPTDEPTDASRSIASARTPIGSPHKKQYRPTGSLAPKMAEPLRKPENFKDDAHYPENQTRQRFVWDSSGCEWRVWMAGRDDAYATVRFRRSLDLTGALNLGKRLIFQMSPYQMAGHLTIGLRGKDKDAKPLMLNRPLADFLAGRNGEWGYFSIELPAFERAGPGEESLNWEKVGGVTLNHYGDSDEGDEVVIRKFLFEL